MRFLLILFTLIFLLPVSNSEASIDLGISIGDEGLRGFYLAVGDYYRVPQREVIIIRERGIPAEETPVVLFIAGRARVSPSIIMDMRLGGKGWTDILVHFRLGPDILYVPVREGVAIGPPYGKAYGYYKKKPKKEWRKIVLSDADVVNLVNLRFLSEHHGYAPERVMKLRGEGKNFIVINDHVKKEKIKEKGKEKEKNDKEKGKGKGKGKKD